MRFYQWCNFLSVDGIEKLNFRLLGKGNLRQNNSVKLEPLCDNLVAPLFYPVGEYLYQIVVKYQIKEC